MQPEGGAQGRGRLATFVRGAAGGLPPVYWYLWVGTFVNRLGGFVVPFLAFYLTRERGFSVAQAGLMASLHGAGAVLAAPLGGQLADRVGRRFTLVGGLWLGSLAMALLGFARSHVEIAVATFTLGLLGEMYRPAVLAAISDVVAPPERPRAFGLLYWVINLGFAVAPPLAGWMAQRSYLLLFLADAATTFLYGLLVLLRVPETRPARGSEGTHAQGGLLTPLADPVFVAFGLPVLAVAFVFFQSHSALPLDLSARGASPQTFGSVLAVNGLLIVLVQPFANRLVGRMRRSSALALSAALTGLGFGMHALNDSVVGARFAVAVWTLGEIAQAPVAPAVVSDLAPVHLRGSYQGAYHMLWGLAACAAPAAGGWALGHLGALPLWGACLGIGVLSALVHLGIGPSRRRRLAQLREQAREVSTALD
ncbi:MFS transporter [Aggregicoccus sp. 17bor-14]|nr:MFS transporter [Simulacricoccus sp. 17bor-14]MRI88814.1 MFS transporter [Aggregicoccus sp. 17bor-14]